MRQKTLNDLWDGWMFGEGVFSVIAGLGEQIPYINNDNAGYLDLIYHGNISGDKITSPLIDKIKSSDTLSTDDKNKIAKAIVVNNKENWDRLYLAFQKEYNPIWNVDGTEITTETNSGTDTTTENIGSVNNSDIYGNTQTSTVYGADTTTDSYGERVHNNKYGDKDITDNYGQTKETSSYGKQSESETIGSKDTENSVSAFNSSGYSKANKTDEGAQTNKNSKDAYEDTKTGASRIDKHTEKSVTDILTDQTYTDTHTRNEKTDITTGVSHTDNHTENARENTEKTEHGHKIETENIRQGNIGITMTQQLLTAEFEMREKYNFFGEIFKSLDKILTIPYYNSEDC